MSIDRLRNYLTRENLDAFLVSRPHNVGYLTGYTGADSYLVVLLERVLREIPVGESITTRA